MLSSYNDPFDELFALQRALDARLASDWMGAGTAASGSYPPVNIFQQGDDFVVVLELPGVAKEELTISAPSCSEPGRAARPFRPSGGSDA